MSLSHLPSHTTRHTMASYRSPSPSSSAGSPAPAGDYSADGIPPLAFETEAEILDVLRQLRGGLQDELRSEWNRLRGAEDQGAMAEETVLKVRFAHFSLFTILLYSRLPPPYSLLQTRASSACSIEGYDIESECSCVGIESIRTGQGNE